MDKAILVIDMPASCGSCPIRQDDEYSYWCPVQHAWNQTDLTDHVTHSTKPDWCPLIPAPEPQLLWHDDERDDWARGYNNCLHEIVGEED